MVLGVPLGGRRRRVPSGLLPLLLLLHRISALLRLQVTVLQHRHDPEGKGGKAPRSIGHRRTNEGDAPYNDSARICTYPLQAQCIEFSEQDVAPLIAHHCMKRKTCLRSGTMHGMAWPADEDGGPVNCVEEQRPAGMCPLSHTRAPSGSDVLLKMVGGWYFGGPHASCMAKCARTEQEAAM